MEAARPSVMNSLKIEDRVDSRPKVHTSPLPGRNVDYGEIFGKLRVWWIEDPLLFSGQ